VAGIDLGRVVLTVCLWHWGQRYGPRHLVTMQSMLRRHLSLPHRVTCITDRPQDVPGTMQVFDVKHTVSKGDFNCIRRMWLYAGKQPKGRPWPGDLGDRLLQLDLDVVLTDSIDPLVDRPDDFVIWKSESTKRVNRPHGWAYNATMMLLRPGARADVWDRYRANPKAVERDADVDGWDVKCNSDQAIATYLLKDRPVSAWTSEDGIYSYRAFAGPDGMKDTGLPHGCRVVSFHGRRGNRHPGAKDLQEKSPWIAQHWH
jgi:hypothetical protein